MPQDVLTVPVITIAREFGAGGAQVGAILANRLGVEVVDRSLIVAVAGRLHVAPEEVEAEDEHPRAFLDRLLRAVRRSTMSWASRGTRASSRPPTSTSPSSI